MKNLSRISHLILFFTVLSTSSAIYGQTAIKEQVDMLRQYSGHWVSSVNVETDSCANQPDIKMVNIPKMYNTALSVEVFQLKNNRYSSILTELISHDFKSNTIVALGQNSQGESFIGKGGFKTPNKWVMEDFDLLGNKTMKVDFDFKDHTDVLLKGFDPDNELIWSTRYIKQNPKDKNIGVQLVSVKEEMEENPERTLKYLNRLGYSFIETFVYKERSFYGYSPLEFKRLVEKYDMKFTGSMTFYDLPKKESDHKDAMKWWSNCIDDHIAAGVEYLTISNREWSEVNSLEELKRYCKYYDTIGKLCREKGILFAYHNHADEFKEIAGVRIYDYMLAHTNADYVSFQADLYWMHIAGVDPITYFQEHENRFPSWHVKDYYELGESGKMNFDSYFKFAQKAGLKYTVAEVEDFKYPVWHSLDRAWNYLYFKIL